MNLTKKASLCAIGSYFLVGLPLAWLFGLKMEYGIVGLELGLGAGILIQLVGYSVIINKADW